MRDSNVADAAKESAQAEFPHGLHDFCTTQAIDVIVSWCETFSVRDFGEHAVPGYIDVGAVAKQLFSDGAANGSDQSKNGRLRQFYCGDKLS
jgi:hypothetical protein